MYFDFIKEREGLESLQKEFGFLTYKINGKECFLANVYIKPEFRKTDKIKDLILEVSEIAKKENCNHLTANVHLADIGANRTLKASYKLDFFIVRAENNIIIIARKLGE